MGNNTTSVFMFYLRNKQKFWTLSEQEQVGQGSLRNPNFEVWKKHIGGFKASALRILCGKNMLRASLIGSLTESLLMVYVNEPQNSLVKSIWEFQSMFGFTYLFTY